MLNKYFFEGGPNSAKRQFVCFSTFAIFDVLMIANNNLTNPKQTFGLFAQPIEKPFRLLTLTSEIGQTILSSKSPPNIQIILKLEAKRNEC